MGIATGSSPALPRNVSSRNLTFLISLSRRPDYDNIVPGVIVGRVEIDGKWKDLVWTDVGLGKTSDGLVVFDPSGAENELYMLDTGMSLSRVDFYDV